MQMSNITCATTKMQEPLNILNYLAYIFSTAAESPSFYSPLET